MRQDGVDRNDSEIGATNDQGHEGLNRIIPSNPASNSEPMVALPSWFLLQQKQPHNNIMMDSDDDQPGSRLILPPVATSKAPIKLPSILQMLGVINKKREEYESELQRVEPSDQSYTLKYARCETDSAHLEKKGITEEESLARGSLVESSFYRRPKRKNRLLAANITSTIEPIKTQEVTSSVPKRAHTRQATDGRYKSESKAEEGSLRRQPTLKETVGEQPQNDINNYFKRSPQFVIPIPQPKREKSMQAKLRARAQTQKQSNVTKENSQSSDQKINLQRFKELIMDLKKGSKTNQRLEKTIKSLQLFNPFFRKVQRVIGVCLLRMGNIKQKLANSILYQMDQPQMSFYIILQGEVKITGRSGMHKVCETGQTLLEEILQSAEGKQKFVMAVAMQKAKLLVDSWILQIERQQFKKLQKELNKFGFRQGLNEMKTLIKRNSIVKTWLRNKFRLLQKK